MNYYEYAPPVIRWLTYLGIKPWHMFTLIFWGSLIIGIILIFTFPKFRKGSAKFIAFILGIAFLVFGTQLDKYYLNYEFETACNTPGIYIKRQVEANGWLDLSNSSILTRTRETTFTFEELSLLKNLFPSGEDVWIKKDDEYCKHVNFYQGYPFTENASVSRNSSNNDKYEFRKQYAYLGEKRERLDYFVDYYGLKDGQCYQGYLSKPRSRYYIIKDIEKRVGLGLRRTKTYIIDSFTGEEIASSYRFTSATNAWNKMLVGGFGDTNSYCNNKNIVSGENVVIKEFRKATQTEGAAALKMQRYTLIPSQYFNQEKENNGDIQ